MKSRAARPITSRRIGVQPSRNSASDSLPRSCSRNLKRSITLRLAILGATGGTGRQVVEQALSRGHCLTAIVRDPARLPVAHDRLRVEQADVFNASAITPLLDGLDAVLSALGPRRLADDEMIFSRAIASVLTAMRTAGTSRIVVVSSGLVPRHNSGDSLMFRTIVKPLSYWRYGNLLSDYAAMEMRLRESATEWTVFRAPILTDGPFTGRYRTTLGRNIPGVHRLSRADLADAMLRSLNDPATVRTSIGIA